MPSPTDLQRLAERERPCSPAVMSQRWEHLLFLHWAWEAAEVQRTLPPGLTVDTFDGRAWLGVVPFFMCDVRPSWLPALPGVSNFLELNLRTYVYDAQGRPGVWFYSLDCNQWLAVKIARTFFHLRYEHAQMQAVVGGGNDVEYQSRRGGSDRTSRFRYSASRETHEAQLGSLEFFLVERYRLFAHDRRRQRLLTGRVWHKPYQIGGATVSAWDDTVLSMSGFDSRRRAPDHICAARPVHVRVFAFEKTSAGRSDFR